MRQRVLLTNFSGGEISPALAGRLDQPQIRNGCIVLENFLITPTGGVIRRPGTYNASPNIVQVQSRLVPFIYGEDDALVLAFSAGAITFFGGNGQIIGDDAQPLTVRTSYTWQQVTELGFTQMADALFMFHPDIHPLVLQRVEAKVWRITPYDFQDGPYDTANVNPLLTYTPSALTGPPLSYTWVERTNPKNFRLNAIECTDFKAMAVGEADGVDAYIVHTSDGVTFNEVTNPKNFALKDIDRTDSYTDDSFFAVGEADGVDAYIVSGTSASMGTEWPNPKNITLNTCALGLPKYGSITRETWLAAGELDGSRAYIVGKVNGIHVGNFYQDLGTVIPDPVTALIYAGVTGIGFVALAGGKVYASTAIAATATTFTITWAEKATISLKKIKYARGEFYALGTDNKMYVSHDLAHWHGYALPADVNSLNSITMSHGNRFKLGSYSYNHDPAEPSLFIGVGNSWMSGQTIIAGLSITAAKRTYVETPKLIHLYDAACLDRSIIAVGAADGIDAMIVSATSDVQITFSKESLRNGLIAGNILRMRITADPVNKWGWGRMVRHANNTWGMLMGRALTGTLAAITEWRIGSWRVGGSWFVNHGVNLFPRRGAFFQQRLSLGGVPSEPDSIWLSETGDYFSHKPTEADGIPVASNAIDVGAAFEQVHSTNWFHAMRESLVSGTSGGLVALSGGPDAGVTPASISLQSVVSYRAADVPPQRFGRGIIMVQQARRILRDVIFSQDADAMNASNLTLLADHITESGVTALAVMETPYPIIWALRADGILLSLTLDRGTEIRAWSRHILGGNYLGGAPLVESICVIPTATHDQLWMLVKRTNGSGATVRTVEFLTPFFDSDTSTDALFMDQSLEYLGAPATVISGLGSLALQTASILADGACVPDQQVTAGGQITLQKAASVVAVGLHRESVLESTRLEAPTGETIQGLKARPFKAFIRRYRSLGGKAGPPGNETRLNTQQEVYGSPPPLHTGDIPLQYPGGFTSAPTVRIVQDQPLPMTIAGVVVEFEQGAG